jgi:surfeit locus 1 family protein
VRELFTIHRFLVYDQGKAVLVNRGWVPRQTQSWHRPQGHTEVTGVLRATEQPQSFTPANVPPAWYWMDIPAMTRYAGEDTVSSYRLDAIRTPDKQLEPPIGGQTVFWMPNNHVTYIATWYSLAGALTALIVLAKKGKIK